MECFKLLILISFALLLDCAKGTEEVIKSLREEMNLMSAQIKTLVNHHAFEMSKMRKEMENIRQECGQVPSNNHARNEQLTLEWAKSALDEVRHEVYELGAAVNSSEWLRQQQHLKNQLEVVLAETGGIAREMEQGVSRLDSQDASLTQLEYDVQQIKNMATEAKLSYSKLKKEFKTSKLEWSMGLNAINKRLASSNENLQLINETEIQDAAAHKYRHDRLIRRQLSEIERSQRKLEAGQKNMKVQLIEIQKISKFQSPSDINHMVEKIHVLAEESEHQKEKIANISVQVSDFDRLHASMLELLESVEDVESKVDKQIPEIRKEISQLESSLAQTSSSVAYLKEGEDNVRQSMKAIAVSVSNVMLNDERVKQILDALNSSVNEVKQATKQHYFRLNDHILKSEANPMDMNVTSELPDLMGAVEELSAPHAQYERLVRHLPHDCSSIDGEPGLYLIAPSMDLPPIHAYCENGYTLLQRRFNGSVDFDRRYADYAAGFGDPLGELWIGNEYLHALTSNNCSGLQVNMTDIYGAGWYARYGKFLVAGPESGYKLETYNFEGNASDAFDYQHGMEFSAKDHDRDISNTHCAGNYEGGWWYSHCQHVNLNGKYTLGLTWFDSVHNEWIAIATSSLWLYKREVCDD